VGVGGARPSRRLPAGTADSTRRWMYGNGTLSVVQGRTSYPRLRMRRRAPGQGGGDLARPRRMPRLATRVRPSSPQSAVGTARPAPASIRSSITPTRRRNRSAAAAARAAPRVLRPTVGRNTPAQQSKLLSEKGLGRMLRRCADSGLPGPAGENRRAKARCAYSGKKLGNVGDPEKAFLPFAEFPEAWRHQEPGDPGAAGPRAKHSRKLPASWPCGGATAQQIAASLCHQRP
jgi:hypothetical protein